MLGALAAGVFTTPFGRLRQWLRIFNTLALAPELPIREFPDSRGGNGTAHRTPPPTSGKPPSRLWLLSRVLDQHPALFVCAGVGARRLGRSVCIPAPISRGAAPRACRCPERCRTAARPG